MRKNPQSIILFFLLFFFSSTPSLDAGWLQEDIAVCIDGRIQQGAVISPDFTGGAIAAWEDARNADIYAQRFNAFGEELWAADGINVSEMAGTQKAPTIIPNGTDGAFIIFESHVTGMSCYEASFYSVVVVTKVGSNGMIQWKKRISDPTTLSISEPVKELYPRACSDGNGGVIIAWTTYHELMIDYFAPNPLYACSWRFRDCYAQRIDSEGNLPWGVDPVLICTDNWFPTDLRATVDSSGATFLVWSDRKPSNSFTNIYAQKLDENGIKLWGQDGVALAANLEWQYSHQIISDEMGGAIVVYEADRSTSPSYYNLFVQRLDPNGSNMWDQAGIVISSTSGEKQAIGIISSDSNSYIIGWNDDTNGATEVFSQRVDGEGNCLWPPNGVMISGGGNMCADSRIAPDGEGGAIFAWEQIPASGDAGLNGIWGFSASDIYSVGDMGTILHYDGIDWSTMESGTTEDLFDVWGIADHKIYAVGAAGTILEYDGSAWSPMTSGVTTDMHGIWGSSQSDIFAVGSLSTILHYNGIAWNDMGYTTTNGAYLYAVHGNASDYAYAARYHNLLGIERYGGVIHFDGSQWHCVYCSYGDHNDIWVAPDSSVYAVGHSMWLHYGDGFLAHYDGAAWENTFFPGTGEGRGVWGDQEGNVYAVFDNGSIGHFDGMDWTFSQVSTDALLEVWGVSPDNIWVVGEKYLIRHLENDTWTTQHSARSNIVMQHVNGLGEKLWTNEGAAATVDIDTQTDPFLRYDPSGHALVVWKDNRNGNWDIYARSISIARGPTVATELACFSARLMEEGIEISWQLSQYDEPADFIISRKMIAKDAVWREIEPMIERTDLSFRFVDTDLEAGEDYSYKVEISGENGIGFLFETESISITPMNLMLYQNFPNPFNPVTTIRYYLPEKGRVTLDIYDIRGGLIVNLVNSETQEPGYHSIEWNGRDAANRNVASGVYFYRLKAGKETISKKLVLLK